MAETAQELSQRRTRAAVLWSHLLGEPLQTAYAFIPFLLYRDLGATVFVVAVLTTLKPLVSIFSMYWSHLITRKSERLLSNVVLTGVLGRLPFLFFPWIDSAWLIIASAAFYMMTYRGMGPAWMEILKRNLPKEERQSIFSWSSALAYGEGVLLAVGIGMIMDQSLAAWRLLFPVAGLIGIAGIIVKAWIPRSEPLRPTVQPVAVEEVSLVEAVVRPWREALRLLKRRPDFSHFQKGFMLCGAGLMIIQPALPLFFVDTLGITYTDLAIAISVCKGLGFTFSCPLWARAMDRNSIYRFSSWVCAFVALFPLLIICAKFHIVWLYVAYLLYGIGQAGSHLCWNLSGPIFSKDEDSATYSSVNVVTVGLRGTVVPLIGGFLTTQFGVMVPFVIGVLLCVGAGRFFLSGEQYEVAHG